MRLSAYIAAALLVVVGAAAYYGYASYWDASDRIEPKPVHIAIALTFHAEVGELLMAQHLVGRRDGDMDRKCRVGLVVLLLWAARLNWNYWMDDSPYLLQGAQR